MHMKDSLEDRMPILHMHPDVPDPFNLLSAMGACSVAAALLPLFHKVYRVAAALSGHGAYMHGPLRAASVLRPTHE